LVRLVSRTHFVVFFLANDIFFLLLRGNLLSLAFKIWWSDTINPFFQILFSFFQIWNWNLNNLKQVFHIIYQSHSFFFFDLIYEVIFFKKSKKVWFYGCIFNIFLFSDEQERKNKFVLQFFEFFSFFLIVQNDNMAQLYTQKFYIYKTT